MDEEVPAGFSKVVTGTNITNTLKTVKVNGEKAWNLKGNDELLPASITVYIKDGETTVDTLTVRAGADKSWKFESKELPKYREDGTTEIEYTIDEAEIPGFEKVIAGNRITNTLKTVKIDGEKKWELKGYSEEFMQRTAEVQD